MRQFQTCDHLRLHDASAPTVRRYNDTKKDEPEDDDEEEEEAPKPKRKPRAAKPKKKVTTCLQLITLL